MDNQVSHNDDKNNKIDKKDEKDNNDKKDESDKADDRVIVSYRGEWYDITGFDHPGGSFLADYHNKVIDEEIENAHASDEPFEILARAKQLSKDNKSFMGIKCIGTSRP